jgi:hypothetical protein
MGAPTSGTGSDAGEPEQSASDSENAAAQQAQTPVADSSQPANTQPSPSTGDGQDTASTSGGGASASPANSDGSADAAGGGSSATAENSDGSAGAGSGEQSALHLAGAGALLQPIFDAANGVASDVTGSSGLLHGLVDIADTVGVGAIGATPSADGHSNLITDLVNFPGDAVGGNLNAGLSHIFTDLSDTANAATGMVGDVLGGNTGGLVSNAASGVSGLLHPATDLIGSASNDLQAAPLASLNGGGLLTGSVGNPGASSSGDAAVQVDTSLVGTNSPNGLLTVNGGNNAGDGGVTGAAIGDLNGSSSGHLVDLAAGPHSDRDSSVGVLTAQPDSGHAATASAVDVGPGGPQLADAGVLTDPGALNIASLNGAGTDGLAGNVLGNTAETGAGALQPAPVATNLGEVHDVLAVPITQDHGILDVNHTHII